MKFIEELKEIEKYQKEIIILGRILGLLNWDNQTYMPKMGSDDRAEQTAYISGLIHEKMTDDKFWKVVVKLYENIDELNDRERRMVEILYKQISKSKKLPKEFVEELSREKSLSFNAWQKAREKNDYNIFMPYFKKIVELKRKEIEYRGYKDHKYNTFLDDYEENMTVEKLDPIFEKLKKELIKIVDKIKKSEVYKKQDKSINKNKFSKDKQIIFANEIANKLGLDKNFSRLDLSEHPFSTTLGSNDARITTNIREDPFFSIGSTIHETGHALYELGMPKDERYNFLGDAPSLGLHESQSRFWENMIGLSKPFWNYFFPRVKEIFNFNDFDKWYKEINLVEPNIVRIESDEVHYCLHVIMRYEFEKGLMEGSINPEEIPRLWNKKIKEYFGLEVKNDKEGFMQDVHWSEGYYGYFPTYALGTIYASQIYKKMSEEIKEIENEISKGNFDKILGWLREKIHKYGSMKMTEDIIKEACGKNLNVEDFLDYLNKKYGEIYDVEF